MFIAHFIWFLIKLLVLLCKALRGLSEAPVHGWSLCTWSFIPCSSPWADPSVWNPRHWDSTPREMPTAGEFSAPWKSCSCSYSLTSGEKNLLRQRISTRNLRGESSQQEMERGEVVEARKRVKCDCLSGAQAPHNTELWGFFWSPGSAFCTVGIWLKPVLLPQWVPYTQGSVKIHIYVPAWPGGLILAMLGL